MCIFRVALWLDCSASSAADKPQTFSHCFWCKNHLYIKSKIGRLNNVGILRNILSIVNPSKSTQTNIECIFAYFQWVHRLSAQLRYFQRICTDHIFKFCISCMYSLTSSVEAYVLCNTSNLYIRHKVQDIYSNGLW